ncbi:HAD family hydrolase [Virgibacillus oceani]|uniref:Phosphatase YkrA n=1 Tax=Virgibacillus oceani TaxID=1479511 RepID=A0A917HI15_9BACI|nr:HAD family hydrolase [Virgibacillus oceani]GGG80164.1 putative phosphatase YkrA [Virgibacillus oceani]
MNYSILFLDIDGTILKPDHTYTASTKEAIIQLQEKGIEVFLATGRPIHEIRELAGELGVDSFIGYNGALAIYQNETIIEEPMDKNTIEEFLKVARRNHHEMVLYTDNTNYFTSPDAPEVRKFIETFQMTYNDTFTPEITNRVLGATVMKLNIKQAELYEIETDIHLSHVNVEGAQNCYDVIRKTVNKGEAINRVLKRLNIPKENAIAFGDGMNDKEMLQAVGEGFAMGNADPELFAYAKNKTATVEESGIFNGLKSLGLVD